jgi:glycosyltransferase involved in cell wall biosynthesis
MRQGDNRTMHKASEPDAQGLMPQTSATNGLISNAPAKKSLLVMTEFFPLNPGDAVTGGVEQRVSQIVTRLAADRRTDVTVLCSRQPGQPKTHDFAGAHVIRCGFAYPYSNSGHIIKRLLLAKAMFWKGLFCRPKPTLVEGTNFISYLPAALVGMLRRVPRIATYHECWIGQWVRNKGLLTGGFGALWERLSLLVGFDAIISVSSATQQQLTEHGVKATAVIPNGVSLDDFKHIRHPPVDGKKRPTISFAGRLVPGKRVDVLLRAAAIVQHKVKGLHVVIIGDGPERQKLETLARELGVDAMFCGFVRSSQVMREIIAASDVFCLPSEVEGFGITVVEAMACGVPVVVADIPPLREVVADGKAGLLARAGDPAMTATALQRVLTDKKLASTLVVEGKKRLAVYNWDSIAKEYQSLVEKVAKVLR